MALRIRALKLQATIIVCKTRVGLGACHAPLENFGKNGLTLVHFRAIFCYTIKKLLFVNSGGGGCVLLVPLGYIPEKCVRPRLLDSMKF